MDGWIPTVHSSGHRISDEDRPVYRVELRPEDGLYLLPYMARQRDGRAWDGDAAEPGAGPERSRQPFYPDAARLFEEIDRFDLDEEGLASQLARRADFDFFRPAPSGGYRNGLELARRTDVGSGDVPPEALGRDYFPYRPRNLRREPPPERLATLTNDVRRALRSGSYAGGVWLEGSPFVEETAYWLNLLVDTELPMTCVAGHIGELGHRNVIDAVEYIRSQNLGRSGRSGHRGCRRCPR